MIDFSAPGYPAREHAAQQAFDKRRSKREPAARSEAGAKFRIEGEPLDAPAAKKPTRAEKLYRKKAVR